MAAQTFTVKTPCITDGRSHMPLARTDTLMSGLNYYAPGRKNKLHTHPGEDHMFVVLDGQATFFDREQTATVLNKGDGILLPEGHFYQFESSGDTPLALLRFAAYKADRKEVRRVDAGGGNSRTEDEMDYACVDGSPIEGEEWTLS
jgi:mannose-6-phosphate isomerase-like protein (cupin superfamily)